MSVYKVCVRNGDLIMADHEHHIIAPGDVIISNNDIYRGKLMVVHDPAGNCRGCPFYRWGSGIKSCNLGCAEAGEYVKLMPVEAILEEI